MGVLAEPRQLRDALEFELLHVGRFSAAAAAEHCDLIIGRVRKELRQRSTDRESAGEVPILSLRGDADAVVFGSSFVFKDDSKDVAVIKRNRAAAVDLMGAIVALDFNQFEKFGSKILEEIGARTSRYTRQSNDQGIDFYGELTVGSLLNVNAAAFYLMHETRMVIVGQAKHYPNRNITTATVRELVGALSLSRTATYSNDSIDLLDGVTLRPFTPLLAVLFSTGDFTKGARTLAARAGLIVFSGRQLAVFLADKGVGIVEEGGDHRYDSERFLAWLDGGALGDAG